MSHAPTPTAGLLSLVVTCLAVTGCGSEQAGIPSDPSSGSDELQIVEVVERFNTAARQVDGQSMCESVLLASATPGSSLADCNVRVTTSIRRKPQAWAELTTRGAIRVRGSSARVSATQGSRERAVELRFELVGGRWFLVPFGQA